MKHLLLTLSTVTLIFGCSKPQPPAPPVEINTATVQTNYDQTFLFRLTQGSTAVDPTTYTWTSSNEYAGRVDVNGKFTARHVGTTTITAISSDKKTVLVSSVTVVPYYTTYTEPVLTYQASSSYILSKETRKLFIQDAKGLTFSGENSSVRYVLYLLDSDKATSSDVLLENVSATATAAANFLKERYDITGNKDGIYYLSDNKTVDLAISVNSTLGLNVIYIPRKSGGRKSASDVFTQMMRTSVKNDLSTSLEKALSTSDDF